MTTVCYRIVPMKLCLCKMLVHCSNCEVRYVHESTTLLDIGLGADCNNGWMFQPSESVGFTTDGKSTGSRRRASARQSDGSEAGAFSKAFTIPNAIVPSCNAVVGAALTAAPTSQYNI